MTNYANRMLALLGFSLSDTRWIELWQELEISGLPFAEERNGRLVRYSSPLGVILYTDGSWVLTIRFRIGPSYTVDLPFGLKREFSIGDVHQLIGPPLKVNPPHGDQFANQFYFLEPYKVWIWYSLEDGALDLISVVF